MNDNAAEFPRIQPEKTTSPLHVQVLDIASQDMEGRSKKEQSLSDSIKLARGNEEQLLKIVRTPEVRDLLLGSRGNIHEGAIGRLLRERMLPEEAMVPTVCFMESVAQRTYRNAHTGSGVITYLTTRLTDVPAKDVKGQLDRMATAAGFFNKWASSVVPEGQDLSSRPSSQLDLRLKGAFGEAFTLLTLRGLFPGAEVQPSDEVLDMKGVDIDIRNKARPDARSACSVKVKAGLGRVGEVSTKWDDLFGVSRSEPVPINRQEIGGLPFYWGGMVVKHPQTGEPKTGNLGGAPSVSTSSGGLEPYFQDAATSFFNKNDPRMNSSDLSPRFGTQILFMLDFSEALGRHDVKTLAPYVCQKLRMNTSLSVFKRSA